MTRPGAEPSSDSDAPEGLALARVLPRLDALVDWERRDRAAGMRVSVEPMRDLLRRLGEPQRGRPLVHVAGTKGKGSTLACVDAALRAEGVRTALFTSPHVESIRERLCVDGRPIDGALFAGAIERALDAREDAADGATPAADATWFDVVVAASAVAADEAGGEVWLVEVGLGGRLDSTNAFDAHVGAVTSIELEHTAVLGDTRVAIAAEKAGIAKAGRALVVALHPDDPAAMRVAEVAAERGARFVPCPPHGGLDERNRALATRLLDELAVAHATDHSPVDWPRLQRAAARAAHALASGAVATARLPGRLEQWRDPRSDSIVVLDGAHVPQSLPLVWAQLAALGVAAPFEVVFTCARDKRAGELLAQFTGHSGAVFCTELPEGRSPTAADLATRAIALHLDARAEPDPLAAFDQALARARASGSNVLATGSLHLLGPLRAALRERGFALQPG